MGEFIGIVVGLIIIYYLVAAAVNWAANMTKDKAAHDALADFDFDKEKEEIKSIGSRYVFNEYKCPTCNGMLVKRMGRYGEFLGCNSYPHCKYTRNLR